MASSALIMGCLTLLPYCVALPPSTVSTRHGHPLHPKDEEEKHSQPFPWKGLAYLRWDAGGTYREGSHARAYTQLPCLLDCEPLPQHSKHVLSVLGTLQC